MTSTSLARFGSVALGAVAILGMAGSALAQPASPAQAWLDQSFLFNVGGFFVQTDMKASLNGQSTQNPEVDFDKDLGKADKQTRVRADALWRITPKHHLSFMYFDNTVKRSKNLERDINWGDNVYQTNTDITSEMRSKIGALSYEYAFMRAPNYEVAANIGLHVSDLKLTLNGTASVNGGAPTSGTFQSNTVTAPLPVIGLRGAWAVTPNLVLEAQGQFFKLNGNGFGGSWSDLRANATWMFTKNFGLGVGYDRYYNHVDVSKDNFDGKVKFGYSGLQLYGTVAF
jgi:hypothetical protein